jgi:hypothetical protein
MIVSMRASASERTRPPEASAEARRKLASRNWSRARDVPGDAHAGAELALHEAGRELGGRIDALPRVALGLRVGDVVRGHLDRALRGEETGSGGVEDRAQ